MVYVKDVGRIMREKKGCSILYMHSFLAICKLIVLLRLLYEYLR